MRAAGLSLCAHLALQELSRPSAFWLGSGAKQRLYGFRLRARISWQGLLTHLALAPANAHDGSVVEELVEGTTGLLLSGRNYWVPDVQSRLRLRGILLQAPFKKPHSPKAKAYESRVHSRVRYRIETVFGQLLDHAAGKRMWARDLWHLCSRILRVMLMHTLCYLLNQQQDRLPLHLARLVA